VELYLIRHPEVNLEKGICYGHAEVELRQPFSGLPDELIKKWALAKAVIYSSPSKRCVQFGSPLAEKMGRDVLFFRDVRLKELNFGNWEMKRWDDIDPEELNKWMIDFVHEQVPGGESFIDLNKRVESFLGEHVVKKNNENDTILVVTHAGVIRSALCQLEGIPLENAFKIKVDFGSVTKVSLDPFKKKV